MPVFAKAIYDMNGLPTTGSSAEWARLFPDAVKRDALEIAGLPAIEVHLSDVEAREAWRRRSTIRELCDLRITGKGCDGYIEALAHLRHVLVD